MDFLLLSIFFAIGFYSLKSREDRQHIALLASHLRRFQIEKLMETLTEGYMRALGEMDPERRELIWRQLNYTEAQLSEEFNSFATAFAKAPEADTRVSTLPVALPLAAKILPKLSFDARQALLIHAHGISRVAANNSGMTPKAKAFTMSAELFLMQHTCHWFCKSKTVASARVLVRHKTHYAQLLQAVTPETREAYLKLMKR